MDYKEYREMVIKTEVGSLTKYPRVMHAIMGMNGEAGECVDILKKTMFQGHEFDVEHLLNELGDVCWYTMLLVIENDIDPKFIFEYGGGLLVVPQAKDKIEDMGLCHILDINRDCGDIVDLYYKSRKKNTITFYSTIRSIFRNVKMAANIYGKTLEDIFDINRDKLAARYPNGFDTEHSVNRGDSL
jgi:hypothetical protein